MIEKSICDLGSRSGSGRVLGSDRTAGLSSVLRCSVLLALATGLSCRRPGSAPLLEPGAARSVRLSAAAGHMSFRVRVPDEAAILRIQVRKAEDDLDLYARFESPIRDLDADPDARAEETGYEQKLWIDRDGDPALQSGVYWVTVAAADAQVRRDGRLAADIGFEIEADLLHAGGPVTLRDGESRTGELTEEKACRFVYRLEGFDPERPLRVDVVAPSRDADLWLASGHAALSSADAEIVVNSSRGLESIVAVPDTDLAASGPLFVTVSCPIYPGSDPVKYEIFAGAGSEPPGALAQRPLVWPEDTPGDPVREALRAAVEVHAGDGAGWGSGVLVSGTGYVLTNDHVVEGPGGVPWGPGRISIAMTRDPEEPAEELFQAEVLAVDSDRDLALMRVVAGVHGEPLPDRALPHVGRRREDMPQLGETLTVIGYPGTGSDTARPTVSLSRGIVSGFVRAHGSVQIKTDAEISFGNSGGPVLDASNRLVGVATSIVEEGGGRLGYVVPWAAVPAAWKARIAAPRLPDSDSGSGLAGAPRAPSQASR